MKLIVAVAFLTLSLLPSPAAAQRMRLAASDCGGPDVATWACDTDEGIALDVVASVISPRITVLAGQESTVDVWFATPVPDWWKVGTGQCRASQAVQVGFEGRATSCVDVMSGWGVMGGHFYLIGPQTDPGPGGQIDDHHVRIRTLSAVHGIFPDEYGAVEEGAELFLFRLTIDRSNTVSAGACPGCAACAILMLDRVVLYQPIGLGDFAYTGVESLFYVQGNAGDEANCPRTATTRTTWGQVKSLYR